MGLPEADLGQTTYHSSAEVCLGQEHDVAVARMDLFCAIVALPLERHSRQTEFQDLRQRRVLDHDSAADGLLADHESDLGRLLDLKQAILAVRGWFTGRDRPDVAST